METDITKGLNQQQVAESRNRHGDNVLTPPEKASVWTQFLEKFKDPLIKILLVALVLSIGIACYEAFWLNAGGKAFLEPLGIFLAVTLATVIGFVIELNANKKFEMLNQMNDDAAVTVVRDGNITQVARRDIVVGDVVILETGDEVPADGNLVDSVSLSINESTLTGEPVIKKTHIEADFKKDATYPSNRALRGTTVTEGHGTMLVDAVGDATEYGKVYEAAQIDNGVKTPLTLQFERLGRLVSYASYTIGALIIVGRLCIYNYGAGFEWRGFIEYHDYARRDADCGQRARGSADERDAEPRAEHETDARNKQSGEENARLRDDGCNNRDMHRQDGYADSEPDENLRNAVCRPGKIAATCRQQ